MAIRALVQAKPTNATSYSVSWSGLLNGDTGAPVDVSGPVSAMLVQLTSGTLGAGGTAIFQGSIDGGVTYFPLNDDGGAAISMTALAATKGVRERPLTIRPSITGGDGTTALVCTAAVHLYSMG